MDAWILVALAVPVALMGGGGLIHAALRGQQDRLARSVAAWEAVVARLEMRPLPERLGHGRTVERQAELTSHGLLLRVEVSTDPSGAGRTTHAWVEFDGAPIELELCEREQRRLLVGHKLSVVALGDELFDRRFVLYAADPRQAAEWLVVEPRRALMRVWELSRWLQPLPKEARGGFPPAGVSLWRGGLHWVAQGAVEDEQALENLLLALLDAGRALSARLARD
jgi:hypothetical protein